MSLDHPNGEAAAARRPPDPALPLFFRRVAALDRGVHAGLKLDRGKGGYGYAAAANALPLAGGEFAAAGANYPIVFAGAGPTSALAVVGTRDGQNLFVDGAGAWRPGKYIPAYARAYPFILLEIPGGERLVLAADPDAECLAGDTGVALFENGKASAALDEALQFCRTLHEELRQTRAFCAALDAAGLLVPNQAMITLGSGVSFKLEGFKVIDRAKFDALDDALFLDWRRRGWLALIYAHFLSTAQWAGIVDLTSASAAR
jgi:hypothetical protein